MKFTRSISALILLLLVMMPVILASIFEIQKAIIRHEMEEALEKQKLVTITLNADEVRWYKKGKEIIVNGEFFDVKKVERKHQQMIFTGLFDKEEKALHKNLDEAFGKEQSGKTILIAKLLLSPFDDRLETFWWIKASPEKKYYSTFQSSLTDHQLNILTPPPQPLI